MTPKSNIYCRYCNQKFESPLDQVKHICKKPNNVAKWPSRTGRNSKGSSQLSKHLKQKVYLPESTREHRRLILNQKEDKEYDKEIQEERS